MTRTKVKGTFKSKPLEKVPVDRGSHPSEKSQAEVAYPEDNFIPFVRVENKRKRAPRGGIRRVKQKDLLLFGETAGDSASELKEDDTSVSQVDEDMEGEVEEGNNDDARPTFSEGEFGNENGMGTMDGGQVVPARRGSLRLKVKPSKFRGGSPASVEKPPAPQDRSDSVEIVLPSRNQTQAPRVSGKDGSKSVAKPVEKHLKRSGVALEGPGSSKRQALSRDPEVGAPEREKIAAPPPQTARNPQPRPEYNQSELKAALMVVKKIMKMEAAEPFNSPVDPVALGIPDYFDVVKNPMDLGTICQTLEKGGKYRNSRDVYEDVHLVWTNCRNYNHKGDPILDLLQRVKKNFMKYWTAAGLYTEKTSATIKLPNKGRTDQKPDPAHAEVLEVSSKRQEIDNTEGHADRTRRISKIVHFDVNSSAKSKAKRSASVEQVIAESKAREAKLQTDEPGTGLHDRHLGVNFGEHEASLNTQYKDLDTKEHKAEELRVISVYKSHGSKAKKKKQKSMGDNQEHQERVSEEIEVQAKALPEGPEQDSEGGEELAEKHVSEEPSQPKKDGDVHGTPGKSRRVSGTGHHKSDCSCVVCTGVRRKLAREGKLGNSADAEGGAAEEDALSKLKFEEKIDTTKSVTEEGAEVEPTIAVSEEGANVEPMEVFVEEVRQADPSQAVPREGANAVTGEGGRADTEEEVNAVSEEGGNTVTEEGVNAVFEEGANAVTEEGVDVTVEGAKVEPTKEEGAKEEPTKDVIEEVAKAEPTKAVTEEGAKGGSTEEMEDKEDAVHNDEHFVDMLDTETDRQEGGVRYYRASYEMPLRKINPSIMQMGQVLFGSGPASPWNRGHSLALRSTKICLENPIFTAVSLLIGKKESLMHR